jgi:hypothetical protein
MAYHFGAQCSAFETHWTGRIELDVLGQTGSSDATGRKYFPILVPNLADTTIRPFGLLRQFQHRQVGRDGAEG